MLKISSKIFDKVWHYPAIIQLSNLIWEYSLHSLSIIYALSWLRAST